MENTRNNENGNKIMKNGATAHNRSVYASPPYGSSGSEKPQSGYALCTVFSPPQFGQGSMLRIALLPAQTVVNSRNVMRNARRKNGGKGKLEICLTN